MHQETVGANTLCQEECEWLDFNGKTLNHDEVITADTRALTKFVQHCEICWPLQNQLLVRYLHHQRQ